MLHQQPTSLLLLLYNPPISTQRMAHLLPPKVENAKPKLSRRLHLWSLLQVRIRSRRMFPRVSKISQPKVNQRTLNARTPGLQPGKPAPTPAVQAAPAAVAEAEAEVDVAANKQLHRLLPLPR